MIILIFFPCENDNPTIIFVKSLCIFQADKTAKKSWKYDLESDPLELFKKVFGDLYSEFETASEDHTSFASNNNLPRAIVSISLKEAATGVSKCINFLSPDDALK